MTKDIATVKAALELAINLSDQEAMSVPIDVANAWFQDYAEKTLTAITDLETALSSPPAIDLAEMKRAYLAYQEECEGEPQDYKKPFIQGAWSMADWLAATGKLAGDDLGEPPQWATVEVGYTTGGYQAVITDNNGREVARAKATTYYAAIKSAMEKMEEGE